MGERVTTRYSSMLLLLLWTALVAFSARVSAQPVGEFQRMFGLSDHSIAWCCMAAKRIRTSKPSLYKVYTRTFPTFLAVCSPRYRAVRAAGRCIHCIFSHVHWYDTSACW